MANSTNGRIRSFEAILLDGSFDSGHPQFLEMLTEYSAALDDPDTEYDVSLEVSEKLRELADSNVLVGEELGALEDVIVQTNEAPTITSASSFSIEENTTAVTTVVASDPDGDDLEYSLSGDDAFLFNIDPMTGDLSFNTAPDYESPNDTNADGSPPDGTYEVEVTVDDGNEGTDTQAIAVTVTDVEEAPAVNLVDVLASPNGSILATDGVDYFIYDVSLAFDGGEDAWVVEGFDPAVDKLIYINADNDLGIEGSHLEYEEGYKDDQSYIDPDTGHELRDLFTITRPLSPRSDPTPQPGHQITAQRTDYSDPIKSRSSDTIELVAEGESLLLSLAYPADGTPPESVEIDGTTALVYAGDPFDGMLW